MKIIIDWLLFLHHSTAVPCQKKCSCMKAILCNESGLLSLCGFVTIRLEPAIVQEYIKADGQKETNGWQHYHERKSALRSHYRSEWHHIATNALQLCMANFIKIIATLKYYTGYWLSAMHLIEYQLSLYLKKLDFILNVF